MEGDRIQIIIGGDTVFDAVCQDWTVLDKRATLAAEVVEAKHPFAPEVPNGN